MSLPTFNIPPVGPKQSKVWGSTQLVCAFNSVEVHYIHVQERMRCSRHYHRAKWNRFLVVEGWLRVVIDHERQLDVTELTPGQITDVAPGLWHWFEAPKETKAMEVYWTLLDAQDIVRDAEMLGGSMT